MAQRLVKIAKELNVGTSTIVEYLAKGGHVIENKPTAKVSDDMYELLLKEFSNSMAVKEKANSIVIGTRKEEPAPLPLQPIKPLEPIIPVAPPEPVVDKLPPVILPVTDRLPSVPTAVILV